MAAPPSYKSECQRDEPTTLMSLADGMLTEILRRLPSLPSLVRAAFACPRLRNVASSSVANRTIWPAPLLGYFISVVGGDIPTFHRAFRGSDSDVAGIVRRGEFYLADFEDYSWHVMDCRQGLLLLTSSRGMAVFDPVASSRLRIPRCNSSSSSSFHCFLPPCGGDATSFRVLCLESTGGGRVRPHVYSSSTGKWCAHSLAPKGIKAPPRGDSLLNHYQPMLAGGRICWKTRGKMLTSLHVGSMEFSHVPLPGGLDHSCSYALGDTEDGTTCIVYVSKAYQQELDMRVWFLKEEDGSSWERQRTVDASEMDLLAGSETSRGLKVYDVTAGVVLLSVGYKNNAPRYLAYRLKDTLRERTTKGQLLILADFCTSTGWVHPFFMAWPRPSLKDAASTENASTGESEKEAATGSNEKKQV